MSAFTADVQIYNIKYLSNISGAVAVLYSPVQNVRQRQSAHALQDSSSRSSLIADIKTLTSTGLTNQAGHS
jgi:hypothetical protein